MATAGPDAKINQVVRDYFQTAAGVTPNWYKYDHAHLTFHDVNWNNTTPVTEHQGLTRTVTVADQTDSQGNVRVTVNQAAVSVRVHLTPGRFAADNKLAKLDLPKRGVFQDVDSIEFDASKEKTDVTAKSVPVHVLNEALGSFKKVKVSSFTTIFEGNFRCTATLSGRVVTNLGEANISDIVRTIGENLPPPFSRFNNSLAWPVRGIAEFTLDSQTHVQ